MIPGEQNCTISKCHQFSFSLARSSTDLVSEPVLDIYGIVLSLLHTSKPMNAYCLDEITKLLNKERVGCQCNFCFYNRLVLSSPILLKAP